jgi:hypothetical protein
MPVVDECCCGWRGVAACEALVRSTDGVCHNTAQALRGGMAVGAIELDAELAWKTGRRRRSWKDELVESSPPRLRRGNSSQLTVWLCPPVSLCPRTMSMVRLLTLTESARQQRRSGNSPNATSGASCAHDPFTAYRTGPALLFRSSIPECMTASLASWTQTKLTIHICGPTIYAHKLWKASTAACYMLSRPRTFCASVARRCSSTCRRELLPGRSTQQPRPANPLLYRRPYHTSPRGNISSNDIIRYVHPFPVAHLRGPC